MENQIQGREEDLGKIVALGEVVSDIYRGGDLGGRTWVSRQARGRAGERSGSRSPPGL